MVVNLAQIRVLLAVVEQGSVTRAARSLNVTQPAVTKRIRELERALGVPLVERSGRGIALTRFGDVFLQHGRTVLAELARAQATMTRLRTDVADVLQVGALPNAAHGLVPVAVSRLLDERSSVMVTIEEDTLDTLVAALKRGTLDLVVGALMEEGPNRDLAQETLFYDRLHIVARRDHPLALRDRLTLGELVNAAWVLPPHDVRAHRQWANAFRLHGLEPPSHRIETASPAAVRALLLSSDRIAVLARQVVELEVRLRLLTMLPVELPSTTRAIGITTRAAAAVSPAARALIAHIRDVARSYAEPATEAGPPPAMCHAA